MKIEIPISTLVLILLASLLCGCNAAVPLHQQVTLTSLEYEETGTRPDYTLRTHTPTLTGQDDVRLEIFNQQVAELIGLEVQLFKQNLAMLPVEPIASGSFLEVDFEQVSPPQNYLSLRILVEFYSDGAAHPGLYSHSLTYDLERGSLVALSQLFLPNSDYLQAIADYCIRELIDRPIAFDPLSNPGAAPSLGNYKNWNLTSEGLLITFDTYQVAAYAAGPQQVTIPFEQLGSIIDPNGPLQGSLP